MKSISDLKDWLDDSTSARVEASQHEITVFKNEPQGFDVTLIDEGHQATVHFDGWHEHFQSMTEAIECTIFGLSDECRLEVVMCGGAAQSWTLESRVDGVWQPDSTTTLMFFPFWRRRTIVHLQNKLISDYQTPSNGTV